MGNEKTPERFSIHLPENDEPERDMPDHLEMVDYSPAGKAKGMPAGAYDPYSRDVNTSDTARIRKPRVDLRKLSEWIKTTQQVKALREEEPLPGTKPPRKG